MRRSGDKWAVIKCLKINDNNEEVQINDNNEVQ